MLYIKNNLILYECSRDLISKTKWTLFFFYLLSKEAFYEKEWFYID